MNYNDTSVPYPALPESQLMLKVGCEKCLELPKSYDEVVTERDGEHLYDTSHHSFHLENCRFCSQIYLNQFYEEIADGGEYLMWNAWIPLTSEEVNLIRDNVSNDIRDASFGDWLKNFMLQRPAVYICLPNGEFIRG